MTKVLPYLAAALLFIAGVLPPVHFFLVHSVSFTGQDRAIAPILALIVAAALSAATFFGTRWLLARNTTATPAAGPRIVPGVKTPAELAKEVAEAATLAARDKAVAAKDKAAAAALTGDVPATEAAAKEAADFAEEAKKQSDIALTPIANAAAREAVNAASQAATSVLTARTEAATKAASASKGSFVGLGDAEAHVTGLKAGVKTLEGELSKILFLMHDAKAKTGQERAAAEAQRVIFRDRFQELIDAHKAVGLTPPAMPESLKDPAAPKPASAGKAKPAAKPTP